MKYLIIVLTLLIACVSTTSNEHMQSEILPFRIGIESDTIRLGESYRARFKRADVPQNQDWKINVTIASIEEQFNMDSVEFIQLNRIDSDGFYLLELTPKIRGTWVYRVMSEYKNEHDSLQFSMMSDTMRFVCK